MKTLHRILRGFVRRSKTYQLLRRIYTTLIYVTGRPHEPAYHALPYLTCSEGAFVDIGANGGQTIAAAARLLPHRQLVCFEPNPALKGELDWMKRLIGRRLTLAPVGLAASPGRADLFVPHAGELDFEARASLSENEANCHAGELEKQLGRSVAVRRKEVEITTLDMIECHPAIIKIDVEGFEHEVLRGGMQTIATEKPAILFEKNSNFEECAKILAALDYEIITERFIARNGKAIPLGGMVIALAKVLPLESEEDKPDLSEKAA